MSKEENIKIVKEAMALEKHGYNFYKMAAEKANSASIKDLFEQFAKEEIEHLNILEKQYNTLLDTGKWISLDKSDAFQAKDIIKDLKKKKVNFDITAVYVAMNLEEKAENYYRNKIDRVEDEEGKKILKWLADWEKGHLDHFHKLNESMKEEYWYDSDFWPLY